MAINDRPNVIEQMPAGGGVNKPASGTYGDKVETERLKQALPQSQPAGNVMPAPPQAAPTPPSAPGMGPAPTGPPGLPAGILAPTRRPDQPVGAPLSTPVDPFAGAVDARQRRMRLLDALSTHPDASPEVREWASVVKQKLIARG
jgi:hypothetical protein